MGRSCDTRERLIETGIKLFYARSYDAVGVAEICEEYPDVTSSLSKLVRVLAANPAIRRHGPSPLRLTVHLDDFARFAAKVRGAAPGSD